MPFLGIVPAIIYVIITFFIAVLLGKEMGICAVMALITGGAGASIPEVTLLALIFEKLLIAAFVITFPGVAILVGLIF